MLNNKPFQLNDVDVNKLTAEALEFTAQSFPPSINAGAFLIGEGQRGYILPPYGTKERDRVLRIYDKMEYNNIWQGATSGLYKKVAATPWIVEGQDKQWANIFQAMLQQAQFGQGWAVFIKRLLRDYLTQDYGAWIEKIGPGPSDGPLMGPVVGIAHLDSGRCYVTGNPTWPVVYYSLMTGKLHKMHHSRVVRLVDMPDPDERYFGIGLSALSRCIGVVQREVRMARFIDAFMDDKPKPGMTAISGLNEPQFNVLKGNYLKKQRNDDGDPFGQSFLLFSMDLDKDIKIQSVTFAQTPEKFDYVKYTELDVNSMALALNTDRQEIWELAGRSIGTGGQSYILAQKAEGKAYGDMLQGIERIINIDILPVGMEFRFKTKNTVGDTAQSDIDSRLATTVSTLAGIPNVTTGQEIRKILVDRSETFADAFTKDDGTIALIDSDIQTPQQESDAMVNQVAPDQAILDKPVDASQGGASKGPGSAAPLGNAARAAGVVSDVGNEDPKAGKSKFPVEKDYGTTRAFFVGNLIDLLSTTDSMSRRRFGIVFRAQLRRLGQMAFKDGLEAGGVTDDLENDDLAKVQMWAMQQSAYVTDFADEIYHQQPSPGEISSRAEMWANKSLQQMYDAGLLSANRNGVYEWILGRTERHCKTCRRLTGQRHRLKNWVARGLLPKADTLDCGGYHCDCKLVRTSERSRGRF